MSARGLGTKRSRWVSGARAQGKLRAGCNIHTQSQHDLIVTHMCTQTHPSMCFVLMLH